MPALSIVLPVFNAASTLSHALDSVRQQTFADWELILVDDGSTDESPGLLESWTSCEPRARLFRGSRSGIVGALNRGLAEASAPFIARMDADDIAHPQRFQEQLQLLVEQPQIGLVGCLVTFDGDSTQAHGYALHVDWTNTLVTPEQISVQRFVESPFPHPSVIFRRNLVDCYGGYRDGAFPEDYELWLRWLDAGVRMAKVPKVLLRWCDHPTRLSRRDARYSFDAFYQCKAAYLSRWLRQHVDPARALLVWGAGRPTRKRADHLLSHGVSISGYIDIDPLKIGRVFSGRPVFSPDNLPETASCFVLGYVAKRGARELARSHLQSRGFVEGRDFLMCA